MHDFQPFVQYQHCSHHIDEPSTHFQARLLRARSMSIKKWQQKGRDRIKIGFLFIKARFCSAVLSGSRKKFPKYFKDWMLALAHLLLFHSWIRPDPYFQYVRCQVIHSIPHPYTLQKTSLPPVLFQNTQNNNTFARNQYCYHRNICLPPSSGSAYLSQTPKTIPSLPSPLHPLFFKSQMKIFYSEKTLSKIDEQERVYD